MSIRTATPAICALLLLGFVPVDEAWALRCGSALINKGDSSAKVLKYCGEPVEKRSYLGLRNGFYAGGTSLGATESGRFYPYGRSEVLVEEWTFNFGPRKLMRKIRLANGIVEEVQTLSYGYRED